MIIEKPALEILRDMGAKRAVEAVESLCRWATLAAMQADEDGSTVLACQLRQAVAEVKGETQCTS